MNDWTNKRVEKVANKVAKVEDDAAMVNVDQAVDAIIAAIQVLESNLPEVQIDNVPQQAAVDAVAETLDTAIIPYMGDIVKALEIFETGPETQL